MSIKLKFELSGIDDAVTRISKLDLETTAAVRAVVRKSGLRLGRRMREDTPTGPTGNLKASIKTRFTPDQLSADVGPTHGKGSHAHLVEFGHALVKNGKTIGHVPAHPFIQPTAEEERPKYLNGLKQAIRKAVKQ
ncbi:hypothetical protein JCM15765_14740 [Paradesulfitobacterium aromaticivorans]